MIELKLRQAADGLAVVLPQEVIDNLGAREGDTLYLINMLNGSYRLARHDDRLVEKMELVDGMMHEEDA
ncbi:hypothetical protein GCM10011348_05440 [Marinobacterium nitratireducens]|uniref:SpoVT-AbrB domain-containing protein n=1 Tax=Marinobacterium nitratireducens TaxID=518897 RepID=A0A917Z7N1_9GAMM|nr:hypothetical protein [Marinobacterium nitratireducens]GGO76971.1 hypothetical protein GCM10011348_05440 [Marinobacterium nitratireducens]